MPLIKYLKKLNLKVCLPVSKLNKTKFFAPLQHRQHINLADTSCNKCNAQKCRFN